MKDYAGVAERLRIVGGKFQPVTPKRAAELRTEFPGIPEDYVGFLMDVGVGSSPDLRVMLPTAAGSVIGDEAARQLVPYRAVVVAYSDGMFGYRADAWRFGMLSTEDSTFVPFERTFSKWIRHLVQHL